MMISIQWSTDNGYIRNKRIRSYVWYMNWLVPYANTTYSTKFGLLVFHVREVDQRSANWSEAHFPNISWGTVGNIT